MWKLMSLEHGTLDLVLGIFRCVVARASDRVVAIDHHHSALIIQCRVIIIMTTERLFEGLLSKSCIYWWKFWQLSPGWNCLRSYVQINNLINKYVQLVKTHSSKYPPWFNKEIIKLIRPKHNNFRRYKLICDFYYFTEFKTLRIASKCVIRQSFILSTNRNEYSN